MACNRAIISVLINMGIRRQELGELRLCDVDRDLRLLTIHRKGNKYRFRVRVSSRCMNT